MSSLTRNLIANFAGQSWSALLNLAAVPLYIRLMGIEAYGLVGFYMTLQIILPLFDFGVTPTMNRTMARYSVQPEQSSEARDFVRTVEIGYWLIGLMVGALLVIAAPWLAGSWIKPTQMPVALVQQGVTAMGVLVVLQFPFGLYQGALLGLQQQVILNALTIAMVTLRVGGAVAILSFVSPTITAFFAWQILVGAFQVILASIILWRRLPPSPQPPRANLAMWRNVWRFAAGMSGITISALILTQIDKVILSNLLSLEMFGYYALAGLVATGLSVVIIPIFNVFFPRFSSLVANGDESALRQSYHLGTQLMAVLVLPIAFTLAFFSNEIFVLWTGSTVTAQNAAPIASVLVIGTALNGLMFMPYALQLAHGWTSLGLRINLLFLVLLVPAIFYLAVHYGAIGAATVWAGLNVIYMLIGVPLTHRRVLKREAGRWFADDVGLPFLAVIACVWAGRQFVSISQPALESAIGIVLVMSVAILTSALLASQVRVWAWQTLVQFRSRTR